MFILHSFDKLATFQPFWFDLAEHAAQCDDAWICFSFPAKNMLNQSLFEYKEEKKCIFAQETTGNSIISLFAVVCYLCGSLLSLFLLSIFHFPSIFTIYILAKKLIVFLFHPNLYSTF